MRGINAHLALFFALIASPLTSGPTRASTISVVAPGRAKAVFLPPSQRPAKVFGGGVAHCIIGVRNSGTALLEVRDVVPGCGCTTVSFDRFVPPGGVGFIHAAVQTEPTWRATKRDVTIFTNDPGAAPATVTFTVDTTPIITVVPRAVISVLAEPASRIHRQFRLHAEIPTRPGFRMRLETIGPISALLTPGPGVGDWTVDATVTSPADGSDAITQIVLHPVPAEFPPFKLSIVALGAGIEHSPSQVVMGTLTSRASSVAHSVVISSRDRWFHVVGVCADPHLKATWTRVPGAVCMWNVILTYVGG